ncbi:hypothetical protein [Microbacterium sp.]|uniref:hypothetical protein n=1 Tax=Microbacterium sp. TaxID=51671 RepID=UPI0028AEE94F|nr:hypothetical protein [Microbacterium sp.]
MSELAASGDVPDSFDRIAADLLALKEATPISYAEIGRRIGEQRIDRGVADAAAFPPRSTVYDAFRAGRTRIDPVLLHDIVTALGAREDEAQRWVERARRLRRTTDQAPRARVAPRPPSITVPVPTGTRRVASASSPRWGSTWLLMLCCTGLNLLGIIVVQALHLPIYLDMVGTAAASIILGPWHGAFVATAGNLLGFTVGAPGAAPYALVSVTGALVWGYGVRRLRMGDDIGRFFVLNMLAATACSVVGSCLNVILFGGLSGHGSDSVTASIVTLGLPLLAAALSANILTSVIDKVLTGFIALTLFVWQHRTARYPAAHMPVVERLSAPAMPPQPPAPI